MDKLQELKKRNNDFKRLLQTDGLGKVFLRDNWEQINKFLGDCTHLIKTIEQQQKEIEQYQLQETLLLGRLEKAEEKMFAYNQKTKWQVYEENLSLAQKLALLNGEMSG